MKAGFIALGLMFGLCGALSAADGKKNFELAVDPPDAVIRVISGSALKEESYRSPAAISALLAENPERAKKNVIEISRDGYKPVTISLKSIRSGDVLKIRLEKTLIRQLKFRMVAPTASDTLMIKDSDVQLGLTIDDKQIMISIRNKTAWPIRLFWQRAFYTDPAGQQHRIMHPGIRYEERNRSFPYQTVMPFMTVNQPIMPVDMVVKDREKNTLATLPLFPPEAVGRFKGKTLELLLPIVIEGKGVVPYSFKIKVLVQE